MTSALNFLSTDQQQRRIACINDMLSTMPNSEVKAIASKALWSAQELLYRSDETGDDHSSSITILLDHAAKIASQVDHLEARQINAMFNKKL